MTCDQKMTDENLIKSLVKPGHLTGREAIDFMVTEMKHHGSPHMVAFGETIEQHLSAVQDFTCSECGDDLPPDEVAYCHDCKEEFSDEARDEGYAEGLQKGREEAAADSDAGSD